MSGSAITARNERCSGVESDHRIHLDVEHGLFVLADAKGPTYGGYHAPFAIDPGVEALVASYRAQQHLGRAFAAAHTAMRGVATTLDAACERRRAESGADPLRAAFAAADDVRPPRFTHLAGRSFAHAGASMIALAASSGKVALAWVGNCRAYRVRGGTAEVLARDHTLHSLRLRRGDRDPNPAMSLLVTCRWMGLQDELQAEYLETPVVPGDRFVLCSWAVWVGEEQAIVTLDGQHANLEAVARRAASSPREDASILVVCA